MQASGPRIWSRLVGPTMWTQLINSAAVDSRERIYVSDGENVYAVDGGNPSLYLSQADLMVVGGNLPPRIQSLDVGPDGRLYLLVGSSLVVSTASHQAAVQRDLSSLIAMWIGVVDNDNVLVLDYPDAGIYRVTASAVTLLYSGAQVQGASDCSSQSLAAQRDGVFAYLPGCNGSPLISGKLDGSGIGILLMSELSPRFYADNFNSVTRSPSGGFVLSVENNAGTWNEGLIKIDEKGNWSPIDTQPPTWDYVQSVGGDVYTMHSRPVLAGPGGAIYIVSPDSIYRLSP
jgi:hypothetical protein